jgi:hypothetical protein
MHEALIHPSHPTRYALIAWLPAGKSPPVCISFRSRIIKRRFTYTAFWDGQLGSTWLDTYLSLHLPFLLWVSYLYSRFYLLVCFGYILSLRYSAKSFTSTRVYITLSLVCCLCIHLKQLLLSVGSAIFTVLV